MKPVIEIDHLSYSYPDGKRALDDIQLQVYAGEKIALLGANGAGKSTLFLHLNGILAGSGRLTVDGMPLEKKVLPQIRAAVGMVFQNPDDQLFSPTVYEDVAYGPIYQGLDRQLITDRVNEALAAVGMSGMQERNPYHLSGGEKKRIAMATVLSMQPKILIFDEPTSGLDPRGKRELTDLLQRLPQTMLIATHDLVLARQLTRRTVIMDQGKIVADGATGEILQDEGLLFEHGLR